jgi:hypothetical protein
MPQISTIQKSLPRYQCHKKVWALKIAKVEESTVQPSPFPGGSYTLTPEDVSYSPFDVRHWFEKFLPHWLLRRLRRRILLVFSREGVRRRLHGDQIMLNYVVYDDGYCSFSPAKAFEEGYTEIPKPNSTPASFHTKSYQLSSASNV